MPKLPLPLATLGAKLLTLSDPETAHKTTISLLKKNILPKLTIPKNPVLATTIAGLKLSNPLGLAAGFDKNAEIPDQMLALGFGFVEVGAVTPQPQPGNPSPRVFRLRHDRAVINRYGFNNDGLDVIAARLAARKRHGIVGINLGANKDSEDRGQDYVTGLQELEPHVDFCTINISSPNTPGLRALQGKGPLLDLLKGVIAARKAVPVFLKIAPDLTDEDKADICAAALEAKIDGLIISNTTIARPNWLGLKYAREAGGLSGAPLFQPSTEVLSDIARTLKGAIPLIGVGGVFTGRDAYKKILAGASLVQLYTAMIYEGPGLPVRILEELIDLLKADGVENISEVVGSGL
ncbi:MAG: quinone-dependent dihydroorotate dehydrogenase [Parvularculaceae bacterium]